MEFNEFSTQIATWAQSHDDILGVALVGSWARGEARADSDVDLVIIAENTGVYINDTTWAAKLGDITEQTVEDWGPLKSVRVFYESGLEVEFGFTSRAWTAVDPVDQGTRRVASDGFRILYDKEALFATLKNAIDALTIRPGTMDDYDEICRLMAQIDKLHRDEFPQFFREAVPSRERDFLESFVVDEERDIFVAEQDGKLSGAIMVEVRFVRNMPILRPRTYVMIDTLIVDEEARSTGIGQALMRAAHEWGNARGISEFQLKVYAFNERAIQFYQKLGYGIWQHGMVWNMPEE